MAAKRILLVEDDENLAELLVLILRSGGYSVDLALTVAQAEQLFAAEGNYILDESEALRHIGGQQGSSPCPPTFKPRCSQTKTPPARRLKRFAGRTAPSARIADR